MDRGTSLCTRLARPVKQAAGYDDFVSAVHGMDNARLRSAALTDVRNMILAAGGVGIGLRGLTGLLGVLKKPRNKTRSGPAELPLPYPVEMHEAPDRVLKTAGLLDFLRGSSASNKAGIPWYGPAMLLGGMGSIAAGYKGMDYLLDKRREAERQKELLAARQEFHDALLTQYDAPLDTIPEKNPKVSSKLKKAAGDSTMTKVGQALDSLYSQFATVMEKQAIIDWGNAAGIGANMYGMYSGLTGLVAGAVMYDKLKKRSRGAIIDKALQRRERRRFMQSPTEVYAIPEPLRVLPKVSPEDEAALLKESMARLSVFAKTAYAPPPAPAPTQQKTPFQSAFGTHRRTFDSLKAKGTQVQAANPNVQNPGGTFIGGALQPNPQAAAAQNTSNQLKSMSWTAPNAARFLGGAAPSAPAAAPAAAAKPVAKPAAPVNPGKQLKSTSYTAPNASKFLD